jgi:LmbE family N-acetylglucosaminyl deacetylase
MSDASMNDEPKLRVLVVVAHPDDCDFGCAGTTAVLTDQGHEVRYCIATDGDAGGTDRSASRADVGRLRRQEQTAAAREVGVHDITFLGYPDGRLTASLDLRRDISRVIRQFRPNRVMCQSPVRNFTRIFASHPDHLAAGEAALCAVYPDARNPFAHPELLQEGLEPHTVEEVWIMGGAEHAEEVVDVTSTIDRKLSALRCHRSQYDDWDALEQRVRAWATVNAQNSGLGEGRSAEIFQKVHTG